MDISNIDLRHLRYFLTVAEELHFTRAAARLHMAQPPLSRQIQELEQIIGTPLFIRTNRSVKLTQAGHILRDQIKPWLAALPEKLEQASKSATGHTGTLRLGVNSATIAHPLAPRLLQQWRAKHPAMRLDIVELNSFDQQEALLHDKIDAGLAWDVTYHWPAVQFDCLAQVSLAAYMPRHHKLAINSSVPLAALTKYPLITFPRQIGTTMFKQFMALCTAGQTAPQSLAEYSDFTMILAAVTAAEGIGIMPRSFESVLTKNLVMRSLQKARDYAIPFWLLTLPTAKNEAIVNLRQLGKQLKTDTA